MSDYKYYVGEIVQIKSSVIRRHPDDSLVGRIKGRGRNISNEPLYHIAFSNGDKTVALNDELNYVSEEKRKEFFAEEVIEK
jgi:hypothetical protein